MDVGSIPLIAAMQSQMRYVGERQAVLGQNIANADTPNYIPQDVQKPSFADMLSGSSASSQLAMARTSPMHMSPVSSAAAFKTFNRPSSQEVHPNGNQVSIQQEIENMSNNQSDYDLVSLLYKANMNMFNTAVDRQGG